MNEVTVGSLAIPHDRRTLACGSGTYPCAVVVSVDPFILTSIEADMIWESDNDPKDFSFEGLARDEYIKRGKARYQDHLKMMDNAKKSSIEREVEQLKKKIEEQNAALDNFSKAFVRISKAFGINSPLVLIANAENNEESFSDILVKIIESKMAEDDNEQRMKNELDAMHLTLQ